MKKDNTSLYFADWTTKKLKEYHQGYKEQRELGQFSPKDSLNGIGVELELANRDKLN